MEENKPEHPVYNGTIPYTIIMDPAGWKFQYDPMLENDIASMAIAQYVLEMSINGMEVKKKKVSGAELKSIKTMLDKAIQARFGLNLICRHHQLLYPKFKKYVADKAEKDAKKQDAKVVSMPVGKQEV